MKLTPDDEAAFRKYVLEYQGLLNLNDWRIEVIDKPAKGAMAQVSIQINDRLAIMQLGKDWGGTDVNEKTLRMTAIHELGHIWLKRLIISAANRDEEQIEELEHSLIIQLEKLLCK